MLLQQGCIQVHILTMHMMYTYGLFPQILCYIVYYC